MWEKMGVLVARSDSEVAINLKWCLCSGGELISNTSTGKQAQAFLLQSWLPHAIFTVPCHTDGTWSDILRSAQQVSPSLSVVVVGSQPGVKLYLNVIESGAVSFVAPPYTASGGIPKVLESVALHTGFSNPSAVRQPTTAV